MKVPLTFTARIVEASGMTPRGFAKMAGIKPKELAAMMRAKPGMLPDIHMDPIWTDIAAHVDMQIGELISIREELTRKLARDRKRQWAHRLHMET